MRVFRRPVAARKSTDAERRQPGWEDLLFADALEDGMRRVAQARWEFDKGLVPPSTKCPDFNRLGEVAPFFVPHMNKLADEITSLVSALSDPKRQERAFGPPGQPGNPKGIQELARVVPNAYAWLLNWAATLRGASAPDPIRDFFAKTALMATRPLNEIDEFAKESVGSIREAIEAVSSNRQVTRAVVLSLELTMDEAIVRDAQTTMTRLVEVELANARRANIQEAPARRAPIPREVQMFVWQRDKGRASCADPT